MPAKSVYARRDGGSLFKRHGAEKTSILGIKEELIDLRERLTGLINKIDKDMGLGQGSEVAQLVSMSLGLGETRKSWVEKGHKAHEPTGH